MRRFLILSLFLMYTCQVFGQKKLPAFGEIDAADLQMKSCSFEPDAAAMKIFETDETDFELYATGGTRLRTEHRTRIKIFSEKGYKHATIRIPYVNKKSLSKIKELTAVVFTLGEDGKVSTRKLGKDDFFKEKVIGQLGFVNFTFPNLKPGCVVEYRYTRIETDGVLVDPWYIQDDIPVAYTSYIIITPPTSILRHKLFGNEQVSPLTIAKKNSMLRYASWYKENVPSFKEEPFMTSRTDNQMKMIFFHFPVNNPIIGTLSSPGVIWSFLGDYMLESSSFGGQIKKQIPGTDKILDTAKGLASVPDKIRYIYNAVNRRFPVQEQQSLEIEDIADAWKEQAANPAEINLILLNLLSKLKLTVHPMLVSTRENGKVDKGFPSSGQLNGMVVVCVLDSARYYVMDASMKYQSLDCPPKNILNREALLLRPKNIEWFLVNDERPLYKQSLNIVAEVMNDGILDGEVSAQYYNYAKADALDTTTENKRNIYVPPAGVKITTREKTLTEAEDDPLYETIAFKYEPQQTNEFFFYNPNLFLSIPENPFTSDTRKTDIDFGYNRELMTTLNITVPASFEIDNLPKSVVLIAADSSFTYKRTISKDGTTIQVVTIFRTGKFEFPKSEYEAVKDFFKRMQVFLREEIVLIKKK